MKSLEGQAEKKRQEIQRADGAIQRYEAAVKQQPLAQKIISTWDQLKEQESKENERIAGVSKERERITAEHGREEKAYSDACLKLEAAKATIRTEIAHLEGNRNVLQATIDSIGAEISISLEGCPKCGYVDPKREKDRKQKTQKHLETCEARRQAQEQIEAKKKELAQVGEPDFPPAALNLPPVDEAELQRIRKALAALNIEAARGNLATAQEAATRLEETRKQKDLDQRTLSALVTAADELADERRPGIAQQYAEAQEKLEAARKDYGEAAKAVAALDQQIKDQDRRISELQAQEKDLGERKAKIEAQQAHAVEWRYLERACGPDGIQALELDAMGPGIAEVANRLLSAAYGSRFTLEFRTTRLAGKGSKTKQVEDFSIWILDSEDGSEQELSTLSGGEAVWIRWALYEAFGIIRDRNTGTRFLTKFQDEADGALDPESRQRYFAMVQAGHQESGRRHTIIITHSPEAQEMIAQRIVMQDLAKKEAVAA